MVNKGLDKNIFNVRLGKNTITLFLPGGQFNVNLDFEKPILN